MSLDTEEVGLIASSCVLIVFLVGFTLVTACYCHRRLQLKKKHQAIRRALAPKKERDRYTTSSQSGVSGSEVPSQNGKLANYRPKILGEQNPKPQEEGVSHRNWREVELRQDHLAIEGPTEDRESGIRTSVVNGKAVSVVNVNGSSTNFNVSSRGRREFQTNRQVYEGYVRAPTASAEQLQVHEWQRQGGDRFSQQSGEAIIVGNLVQRSSGEPVRGQIIKQNVEVGEGGRLVVTNTEQRSVGQIHGQQSTWGAIVSPVVAGGVQGQIIKQNVEMGDDGKLVVTGTEQRDIGETSQAWTEREQSGYSIHQRGSYENVLPRGLFTPTDHVIGGWQTSSDIAVERLEARQQVPDIVVADEHGNEAAPASSSSRSSSSSSGADDENELPEPPTEPVAGEFYSDSKKYKVIKRHSAHKPPDWLVQTYAESASDEESHAREHRDSAVQVDEEIQEAALSVSGSTKGVTFGATSTIIDDVSNTRGDDDDRGVVTTWVSGAGVRPVGESVTITDYVDPGEAVTTSYQAVEASGDGSVTTTRFTSTSMTATAVRHARQQVDESAEALPPAFTSTPRVPWEAQASETTFIEAGGGLVTATTHQRQRSADMGNAPEMPSPSIVEIIS